MAPFFHSIVTYRSCYDGPIILAEVQLYIACPDHDSGSSNEDHHRNSYTGRCDNSGASCLEMVLVRWRPEWRSLDAF